MKISLLLAFIGLVFLGYGWASNSPVLGLVQLLQMDTTLQQAYYQDVNRATLMQLGGCLLIGIGFVSFVIIRSRKIHKKVAE